MPKFFVTTDIHGFYSEFISALYKAGFSQCNEDHWLVVCGDYFDRGKEPKELLDFLNSLPRKILVRGNHENLILNCIERGFPYTHDISNGTWGTIRTLGKSTAITNYSSCCLAAAVKLVPFIEQTINYFETQNHIFVHGWIPTIPNWREAHQSTWDEAMWLNGMKEAFAGHLADKTVVCGHWHSSYGHSRVGNGPEHGEGAVFDPYYNNGIIALDACTAYSKQVNVIVIEDDFLEE